MRLGEPWASGIVLMGAHSMTLPILDNSSRTGRSSALWLEDMGVYVGVVLRVQTLPQMKPFLLKTRPNIWRPL